MLGMESRLMRQLGYSRLRNAQKLVIIQYVDSTAHIASRGHTLPNRRKIEANQSTDRAAMFGLLSGLHRSLLRLGGNTILLSANIVDCLLRLYDPAPPLTGPDSHHHPLGKAGGGFGSATNESIRFHRE